MSGTDATRQIRRTELGGFLKASRGRLRPDDVGIEPGGRRRTPGLRREEVALLAGVGVTWYTWLEQGRPINASWQVLDAVAAALRLDGAQRWHLYQLSEATPVRSIPRGSAIPESVRHVLDALDPLPATLTNTRFDVLASNRASQDLFRGWHSLPCVHYNLLWCSLTEPRARDLLLNYDEVVPYLVARLRAAYGRHLDDPEWTEDIRRLSELSPEFTALWARHEVTEPQVQLRHFHHPAAGELRLAATELEVTAMPETRIMVSTPVDEQSRLALQRTRLAAIPSTA